MMEREKPNGSFWDKLLDSKNGSSRKAIEKQMSDETGVPTEYFKAPPVADEKVVEPIATPKTEETPFKSDKISLKDLQKIMTPAEMKAAEEEIGKDAKFSNYDDKSIGIEDYLTGGYNTINSALFGIPDVIVKSANTDAYKQLQAMRERNKVAATVGDIAGLLVPTGGLVAGAVGKGAKAIQAGLKAGKGANLAGKIAKGADTTKDFLNATGKFEDVSGLKGIGQGIGRGATETALQVAPRLASGETDIGTAAGSTAIGAGLGGAFSLVPAMLRSGGFINKGQKLSDPIQDKLIDAELAAHGISGRDIKMAMNNMASTMGYNKTGNQINNADEVKRSLLKLMKENDIRNADEARKFIQGTGKKFQNLQEKLEKDDFSVYQLGKHIYMDPETNVFLEKYKTEGEDVLEGLMNKYENIKSLTKIKREMSEDLKFSNKATDRLQSDTGDIVNVIKNAVEDKVLELDPDYEKYKTEWRTIQPLRNMVAREKVSIAKPGAGSDTAAKLISTAALGGISGAAGGGLGGFKSDDPSTWTPAVIATIGGLATGGMLNELAPAMNTFAVGELASALNNPKVLKLIEKAGYIIPKANIPAIIEKYYAQAANEETPNQTRAKLGEIQPSANNTEVIENGAPIGEVVQKRTAQYGPEYIAKLDEKMANYWNYNFSDKMSYEDYLKKVQDLTDNFAPEKTASFLYSDKKERAKFLLDLRVSKKLSNINLEQTYAKPRFMESREERSARQKQQMDLVDTISSLVTDPGNVPTKQAVDTIKADINAIVSIVASPEEKRKMLLDLLANKYSLKLSEIKSLGLI